MSYRSWIFTIYPKDREDPVVERLKSIPVKRMIAGFENCPSTGRLHIQGAVVFSRTMRMKSVKRALGDQSAHLEPMRGRWDQQDYCLKDGDIIRSEDNAQQGKRMDLLEFRESIKRKPNENLLDMPEEKLQRVAQYPRLYDRLKFAALQRQSRPFRKVEVHVRWGEAGTGKTKKPYEEGAYVFGDYENGWWDGYEGEPIILFDDFYGGIKWGTFLTLLDGYQVRLNVKGTHTWSQWTKVYITSNKHPRDWYAKAPGDGKWGLCDELARRITSITHFEKPL